jgi:hypothetical protein
MTWWNRLARRRRPPPRTASLNSSVTRTQEYLHLPDARTQVEPLSVRPRRESPLQSPSVPSDADLQVLGLSAKACRVVHRAHSNSGRDSRRQRHMQNSSSIRTPTDGIVPSRYAASRLDIVVATLVLFTLAVAHPLLDLLGRHPEFFVAHQAAGIDVLLVQGLSHSSSRY